MFLFSQKTNEPTADRLEQFLCPAQCTRECLLNRIVVFLLLNIAAVKKIYSTISFIVFLSQLFSSFTKLIL